MVNSHIVLAKSSSATCPRCQLRIAPRAGIDYMHPDLGGGFGPGYRVITGYDYVGDAGERLFLDCKWQR